MMNQLRRFWIIFEGDHKSALGYGVTAWTEDDALGLVCTAADLTNRSLPNYTIKTDADISTLDAGHIIPNMGSPNRRGVWFPCGFAEPN